MKKIMRLMGVPFVLGVALVVGGCGFDGSPIITEDIGTIVDDNAELSVRVKQALRDAPQTATSRIRVTTVSEDTVKLSGFLMNKATIHEAERVAGQVPGVRFVVNSLVVQ